jgi:hypothetical protein
VDSEPGPPPGRHLEIDARLAAIRVRLQQLGERDWDAVASQPISTRVRLEAAQRYAAEAQAAALQALAASAAAFRRAAEAHDRVASVHERTAAARIGDVAQHERQAAHHRAAAAADRLRADRAQSVLPDPAQAEPAAVSDDPGDGMVR